MTMFLQSAFGFFRLLPRFVLVVVVIVPLFARAGFWGYEGERADWFGQVWEHSLASFDLASYEAAVEKLISGFEETTGRPLLPGEKGKVGLKVYTNSGAGLDTPHALTEAVIRALGRRGFARSDLLIVDASTGRLREAGYLPALAARDDPMAFHGVPVVSVDSGRMRSEKWFYESPVPAEFSSPLGREMLVSALDFDDPDQRKSMLPTTLLTEVDFWINLPMVTDHWALGVNGALVNSTLWNISNRTRFFASPANAPVAVAEIAAIPEVQDTWALTIMPLERYQFVGGPAFNSLYTLSEPLLWLSADPVILDALILQRINRAREEIGFRSLGVLLPMIDYCVELGLGYGLMEQAHIHRVE